MAPPVPDPGAAAPGAPTEAPSPLGLKAAAAQKIAEARKTLEASLVIFGSESEEGQALVTAIKALGSIFPSEPGAPTNDAGGPAAGMPMRGPQPGAAFGM